MASRGRIRTSGHVPFSPKFEKGWPGGLRIRKSTNSYTKDPIKETASLYKFKNVTNQIIADDTWWTGASSPRGTTFRSSSTTRRSSISSMRRTLFVEGRLAAHGHDPGSTVFFKNIKVKPLEVTPGVSPPGSRAQKASHGQAVPLVKRRGTLFRSAGERAAPNRSVRPLPDRTPAPTTKHCRPRTHTSFPCRSHTTSRFSSQHADDV